ncbi:MAG TPA: hypothetical protein VMW24_22900 [Sedimentisphaerales bacterium]|nr:hypothetical protein [Sedimentisphaerales bacterium]
MKRISFIVLAALFVASGAAEAHDYYSYSGYDCNHVRWSIYTHSLVPGDLYYSPYAYSYGQSGLVPYWVRYSPYAFGLNHPSGLVNDYVSSPISANSIYYYPEGHRSSGWSAYDYGTAYHGDNTGSKAGQRQASYAAHIQARRDRLRERQQASQERTMAAGSGGDQIVAAYLRSKNIDFTMNRLFQIGSKTISADFQLTDRNIIVKYWDPVEILALDQQAQYRKLAYENYLKSWKDFCGQYQRAGGTVYSVVSADSAEILAKLTDCTELNGEVTTYALAQGSGSIVEKQ